MHEPPGAAAGRRKFVAAYYSAEFYSTAAAMVKMRRNFRRRDAEETSFELGEATHRVQIRHHFSCHRARKIYTVSIACLRRPPKARQVAAACARGARKVCKDVIAKRGAMARS